MSALAAIACEKKKAKEDHAGRSSEDRLTLRADAYITEAFDYLSDAMFNSGRHRRTYLEINLNHQITLVKQGAR